MKLLKIFMSLIVIGLFIALSMIAYGIHPVLVIASIVFGLCMAPIIFCGGKKEGLCK